eukprot:12288182-Alexandrium_andersonii.AAC.1
MLSFHSLMRLRALREMAVAKPADAAATASLRSLGMGLHCRKASCIRLRARLAAWPLLGPRVRARAQVKARAAPRAARQAFS